MEQIQKAGSYFLRVTTFLFITLIVNTLFYLIITNAYSPKAMLYEDNGGEHTAFSSNVQEAQRLEAQYQAEYEAKKQEAISKKVEEKSVVINVFMVINLILFLCILNYLYSASSCLYDYGKKEKLE